MILTTKDELFVPKDKFAIIGVTKDSKTGYQFGFNCYRWDPTISGNMRVYDWELLMKGNLDFGETSPLNLLKSCNKETSEIMHKSFREEIEYRSNNNLGYREVIKLWPGTREVLPEFKAAVSRLSGLSDESSLTNIRISSHGGKDCIQMGNTYLHYPDMLRQLDNIKGKKVLFIYACYSGILSDRLKNHKKREDYCIVTSCRTHMKSTNWGDETLDDLLFEHLDNRRRFSEFSPSEIKGALVTLHPQVFGYFDFRI